jgi:CPA2 family monovalent cation:H+ antiporter-2
MGRQLEVLPEAATQVLVVTSIVSITLNPVLFRAIEPLMRWLDARSAPAPEEAVHIQHGEPTQRTIVVGHGPVGHTLTRLLREHKLGPVVIELNQATVQQLHEAGVEAIHGDASQSEVLLAAGVDRAHSLIFAASGTPAEPVIRAATALNPTLLVLARCAFLSEAEPLRAAGAHVVVTAEAEVALAMAERLLAGLGASPEQLDRERDRVRAALAP